MPSMRVTKSVRNTTILLLTLGITLIFLGVVHEFLMSLLLAALFVAISMPLYRRILRRVGNRAWLASTITLALVILLVVVPLLIILAIVTAEAIQISEQVIPWVEQQLKNPERMTRYLPEWLPWRDTFDLSDSEIRSRLAESIGQAGQFLLQGLAAVTSQTASFLVTLFVMLYAMFFFYMDGEALRDYMLSLVPLPGHTKKRLIEKGVSVTRATIKGTMVIGAIQGTLAGISFVIAGVPGAVLWGALTAVASAIPAVGTPLVWGPVVVYLAVSGKTLAAVLVTIWCAALVGTADNILRPRLVGSDTQMPDLLILISTLGGLSLFGAVGLLVGPIVAALFVTMWDVLGETFRKVLQEEDQL